MELYRNHVCVCGGGGCLSSSCTEIARLLEEEMVRLGIREEIKLVKTGCMGPCSLGPVMIVYPQGIFYCKLKPEDIPEIVQKHLYEGIPVSKHFYTDPYTGEAMATIHEIPYFTRQKKIALRNVGMVD